uniref:RHS repeat domain-containing protein n=1 Tax=Flavobacterium sp. TaxID=239 RepID=UPI0025EBC684
TTGDDYVYDANGNMTVDKNKNISSIVYNHLNLPTKIVFPTGNIVYIYNASGQKIQKVVTENTTVTTTDYFVGGYQYKNAVLQYFPTTEGYVKNTPVSGANTYSYVFNYTDHLGNTRLSYTKDATTGSLKILEESNYYPFGMKHNGYNPISPIPENRRLFNGKELQEELGLNQYDYGSRMYDPARAGWSTIDPLTEKMRRWSPYNYCFNNPMRFTDPDGMAPNDWVLGSDGQWSWRSDINSKAQAKAAGYSDYSDGKSNNTYSQGGNTITLKENAKWVSSSDGKERTAADQANPTAIAEAKVSGEITTVVGSTPEYEFSADVLGQDLKNAGEFLSKSSTYAEGAGILVTGSSCLFGPEMIPLGVAIFDFGAGMGTAGSGSNAVGNGLQGQYKNAAVDLATMGISSAGEKAIDAAGGSAAFKQAGKMINEKAVETTKKLIITEKKE